MPGRSRLGTACRSCVATSLLILTTTPLHAQDPGSRQTREFVQAATQSDQFEILEGYTVLTESKNPKVRAFASSMIRDHEKTGATLQDAVMRAGLIPPPKSMGGDQAHMLGALQSLRGADFDKAYIHQQALAHRAALTVEQQYATGGDTLAIRQAAAAAIPIIASHLAMAERMLATMGDP